MRKMSVPCEMLLHPELLTNQQLMAVILERHLRVPHIELMSRDQLLELFHDYCVPYGQRRYRDSGRGKMLNKSRNIEDKPEPMKLDVLNYSSSVNLSFKHANERVKAPPDLLSGHIKRIRISVEPDKKTISYDKEDKNKRKMSIDSEIAMEATPPKKGRKPITWP